MLVSTFMLAVLASAPSTAQQSVHIRILNGRTGKPITKAQVTITTYRNYAVSQIQATEAGDGYTVPLSGETSIGLGNISGSRTAWNEFDLCAHGESLKPLFSVAQIRSEGIVAPNECSPKVGSSPSRGEITFFVRPRTLWEKIRDYHFD